jgi:ABC-type Fe3+ transport system permease subunit
MERLMIPPLDRSGAGRAEGPTTRLRFMPRVLWRRPGSSTKAALGVSAACVLLAAVFAAVIGWPTLYVVIEVARGWASGSSASPVAFFGPGTAMMLFRTIVAAGVVSGAAVVIAYPIAWALRSRRSMLPWIVLPMLMPSYVAYAGWGVLRAPRTILGTWIAGGSVGQSELKVRLAYDVQAVLGLSLWAWPIAAIIIAAAMGRLSSGTIDALRLEPASAWRRRWELVTMTRSAMAWAFGVVFVLMLGSAVPFHVAQLETYAIAIWRLIDLTPPSDRWGVWVAASPLIAVTLGVGVVFVRGVLSLSDESPASENARVDRSSSGRNVLPGLHFGTIWALSVIVPTVLLVTTMQRFSFVPQFFRENSGKIFDSLGTALGVAAIAWLMTTLVWFIAQRSRRGKTTARACVAASLLVAPVPGLLIGLATSRAWNLGWATSFVADTSLIVILVHTARFAFVPALVGWWLARTENRSLVDLSRIDGAESVVGWLRACFLANAWPTVAAAIVVAMLSFQEIEASIMVVPAGYGSMSGWMLQQLHYLRQDALAAGVVFMLIPALVGAVFVSWCLGKGRSRGFSAVVDSGRGT